MCKIDIYLETTVWHRELSLMLCDDLKGWDEGEMEGKLKEEGIKEQDGRGLGRRGVDLSSQIHQEYTFRHRSPCRTTAESGQEYLTSRKEYIESCKTG